jgi:broad specificity phosphatase PhoE
MKRLILTRKGETEANLRGVYQGQSVDSHLTSRGEKQARLLGEALKEQYRVERILTSPLMRAKETARAVAEILGVKVEVDEDLIEMNFGRFEGKTVSQAAREFPDAYQTWKSSPSQGQMPGGECFEDVLNRAGHFLEKTRERKEATLLAVTHDAALRALLTLVEEKNPDQAWDYQLFNCSINEVDFTSAKPRLVRLNGAEHLISSTTDISKEAL